MNIVSTSKSYKQEYIKKDLLKAQTTVYTGSVCRRWAICWWCGDKVVTRRGRVVVLVLDVQVALVVVLVLDVHILFLIDNNR